MSERPGPGDKAVSLQLLSVVIPAQSEEGSIAQTVAHLYDTLQKSCVPHEIVVVDDGSVDGTWSILQKQSETIPTLRPTRNDDARGFGRAVNKGIDVSQGDAVCYHDGG